MKHAADTPKHNLRTWVLILALVPTIIVGILLATIFTVNRTFELDEEMLTHARQVTEPMAIALSVPLANKDRADTKRLLNNIQLNEPDFVKSIAIFDKKNQLFVTSHYHQDFDSMRFNNSLVTLKHTETETHGDEILIRSPIYTFVKQQGDEISNETETEDASTRGTFIGYITIILNKEKTSAAQRRSVIIAFIMVLIAIQLNLMFTIRLVRHFTGPILEMVSFISQIEDGKYLPTLEGSYIGELDNLRRGINNMAQSLSDYNNKMQNDIEQATSDLLATLERIEIQNVELDIAKKHAQEASKTKSEFLANMSHELRTPLNGVIGFAKQLAKTPLHSSQLEYIQTIERSANNLLTIINDILDFSKLEAGKMVIESIPFCLRDTIDETMMLIAASAHEKGLEIVTDVEWNVPDNVNGDAKHLNQILTNLVGNAIKFTTRGTVALKVRLESNHLNKVIIRFEVHDTGIGISAEKQKLLFQAFAQADSSISRRFGGTGLGLIITQRLLHELKGEIGFSSEEGKGSIFWFSMPLDLCQFQLGDSIPVKTLADKSILYYEPRELTSTVIQSTLKQWQTHFRRAKSKQDLFDKLASSLHYDYLLLSCNEICHSSELMQVIKQARKNVDRIILVHDCMKQNSAVEEARPYVDNIITTPFTNLALGRQMIYTQQSLSSANEKAIATLVPQGRANLSVLAVDDNKANLKLIEALLNEKVTHVTTASSGAGAVEISKSKTFDLILMDIQMPDIDGIHATQLIKQDQLNRTTPIIAVTAHAMDDEINTILTSGLDGYLAKPIDEQALTDTIQQWVIKPKFTHFDIHTLNWELCLSQASQKQSLAIEMLEMLLDSLPETTQQIQSALVSNDSQMLLHVVHKLHGACCYCGVPTTQHLCQQIESSLKQQSDIEMIEPEILELLDELTKVESAAKQVVSQLSSEVAHD
ncbi:MAG: two-component sensor histidine kinase BarA [Parashewanella sp.]